MTHLSIYFKSAIAFFVVWFSDLVIFKVALLSIINPQLKEILIDLKEVISILVSIAILYLTIVRIKNEKNKK